MRSTSSRLTAANFLPEQSPVPSVSEEADAKLRALRVVKACPDGITTGEIAQALGVTKPTAFRALRELEREREVYSRAHTKNQVQIWYPNGRLVHPFLEVFRELRGRTYRTSVQAGHAGPMVQIQERSFSLLSGDRVEGAVFVELGAVDEMIEMLNDVKQRYERFTTTQFPPARKEERK